MSNKSKMIVTLLAALTVTSQGAMAQESLSQNAGSQTSIEASGNASLESASGTQSGEARTYLDVMVLLEGNGYQIQEVKSTFLGRVMITAENRVHRREIVMSRTTGEIMSDVILEIFATDDNGNREVAAGAGAGVEGAVESNEDESGVSTSTSANVSVGGGVSIGNGGSNGNGEARGGGSVGVSIGLGK